jgi:dUTP pyrophosphatase
MPDSDEVTPSSTPVPNALRWDAPLPERGPDYAAGPELPEFEASATPEVAAVERDFDEMSEPELIYSKDGDPLPFKRPSDAGQDLCASKRVQVPARGRALVHTGLRVVIPAGYELQVRSRSGLALKRGIMVLNSPGTVDENYRGEVGVILFNTTDEVFDVTEGDRVAQLVMAPVVKYTLMRVERIDSDTDRGEKGFGSSGV